MTAINKQSILKAFYRFDQKHIPLTNIEGAPVVNTQDISSRQELCELWLESFAGLDAAVWEKVILVVLDECREYPRLETLYEIIDRLTSSSASEQYDQQSEHSAPVPPQKVQQKTKILHGSAKIKAMLELAKQGKYTEAKELVQDSSVPWQRIYDYAKQHWPECTETWMRSNEHELVELVRADDVCSKCYSLFECPSKGYCSYGAINKHTGGLSVVITVCGKKRGSTAK